MTHPTATPEAAAAEARATASHDGPTRVERLIEAVGRPWDEPVVVREHTCTSPDPARCLFCALDDAVAAQKEAQKLIDEVNRERNAEWWAD